jgi:hypothetical protein
MIFFTASSVPELMISVAPLLLVKYHSALTMILRQRWQE